MSVTVLTPASTYRLTTLDAVMAEVPLADQLNFAERLIDQASAAVSRYCGRVFAQQSYRELLRGMPNPGLMLLLTHRPIISVSSITGGTVPITDYRIEQAEAGMLYRVVGWCLSSAQDWTVDYVSGYRLPEQVTPVVPLGPALPGDVERACIECIKVWFHEQYISSRIESRTLGDQRIDYGVQARQTALPVLSQKLLAEWRLARVA